MKYLDLTLPTPAENLACDEVLLELCEQSPRLEVLRVWEPAQVFVVLGCGNKAAAEADLPACGRLDVPVLRRSSGGGAVVLGPGCLSFALVLQSEGHRPLSRVTTTASFVLDRTLAAIRPLLAGAAHCRGTGDLATGELKFAGTAQRRLRRCVLVHGVMLLGFKLQLMNQLLRHPSREPAYRRGRGHLDFVANVPMVASDVKHALRAAWGAGGQFGAVPGERIRQSVAARYGRDEWNFRH